LIRAHILAHFVRFPYVSEKDSLKKGRTTMVTINGLSVSEFQLGLIIDALDESASQFRRFDNEDVADQCDQLRRAFVYVGENQGRTL
jgi:hypothetical protein